MTAAQGVLICLFTAISFNRLSKFFEMIRTNHRTEPESNWRFCNYATSLAHSLISGCWSLHCFYDEPDLYKDMISTPSQSAYWLASFSNGYFCYDLLEMIFKFRKGYKGSGELIGHHCLVISCLSISVWTQRYLGYAVGALVVEINNIFLHSRQLLNIAKVSKKTIIYRLNCWSNIASFIVFRMLTLVWLGKCLYDHRGIVPALPYATALLCLIVVGVMTCVLFYRIIHSDFIASPHKHQLANDSIEKESLISSSSAFNDSITTADAGGGIGIDSRTASTVLNHSSHSSSNGHSTTNNSSQQILSNCNLIFDKLSSSKEHLMNKFK